ncbi:MAG: hypothetical protein BWY31_00600 [Lentisphaerae bacterium ADurb.Bin242]|nr:MAG: hypothetical protein BWY31_00600 [Lentisphaerae bacterium ADurb.Bin242]
MKTAENTGFMQTVTAKEISCTADGGKILSLSVKDRQFNGFTGKVEISEGLSLTAEWSAGETFLICDIVLTRIFGNTADGGGFSLRIPYPEPQSKLMAWAAREGFPKPLYEVGSLDLVYGDVCYGTIIPAVSIYSSDGGGGVTVARAPGRIGGRLSFRFGDYHQEGVSVEMTRLEVRKDKPVRCRLLFFGHEACWRPGLRQYAELYKEYFEPVNPEVWDCRSFVMTNPFFRREATAQLQCDWAEIHNHFPYYGNYLPDEPVWESVIGHDYPEEAAGRDLKLTRQKIRDHIRDLHDAHVKALYYLQCGGDALVPWAKETFPESMAEDSAGHLYPTWKNCCFTNADSRTPFGKYLDAQLENVLKVYPELDGIFTDQLCYQTFDYAHQDGRSAVDGKCIYEYGASLDEKFRKIAHIVHEKGKLMLVNGPFDMDVAKDSDAIMSEGASTIFETYRYICIRKPMLVHEFPSNVFNTECMLRNCLLAAAGWSIGGSPSREAPPPLSPEVKELYRQYLPLVRAMSGAELLLEPDPLHWYPQSVAKAEIFRSRANAHILVPVLQTSGCLHSKVELQVRNFNHGELSARILRLGKIDWEPISFKTDGTWLIFNLPDSYSACVLDLISL